MVIRKTKADTSVQVVLIEKESKPEKKTSGEPKSKLIEIKKPSVKKQNCFGICLKKNLKFLNKDKQRFLPYFAK